MDITKEEFIEAVNTAQLGTSSSGKDKILEALQKAAEMGPQYWLTISVIDKHIELSQQRIRTLLKAMVKDGRVEEGQQGTRNAYRLKHQDKQVDPS